MYSGIDAFPADKRAYVKERLRYHMSTATAESSGRDEDTQPSRPLHPAEVARKTTTSRSVTLRSPQRINETHMIRTYVTTSTFFALIVVEETSTL